MLAAFPLFDSALFEPRCRRPATDPCLAQPISAHQDDNAYHVSMAVPGVRTSDLSAELDERTLRVTGETKTDHRHVRFDRSITLPKDADFSSADVKLVHEDGMLTISVPKRTPPRRQLVINAAGLPTAEVEHVEAALPAAVSVASQPDASQA